MAILIPILILGTLGALFGVGLALAAKKLEVKTDHRLEAIMGLLPGANCGACGGAGCFGFAEQVLKGEKTADGCRVAEEKAREEIAKILGVKVEKKETKVARVKCYGGKKVKERFTYEGPHDCIYAQQLLRGNKECVAGCLGMGTCVRICPFGAIRLSDAGFPIVDEEKCKACGKCVDACPRKLFVLLPKTKKIYVTCSSHFSGRDTRAACPAGCIACKLCEKACSKGAIKVIDNLAQIDYALCDECGECVKVCPAKAIKKVA